MFAFPRSTSLRDHLDTTDRKTIVLRLFDKTGRRKGKNGAQGGGRAHGNGPYPPVRHERAFLSNLSRSSRKQW